MMVDSFDDSIDFENNANNFGNTKQLKEAPGCSRDVFFDESNKLLEHSVSEICIFVAEKCDVTFSTDFVNVLSECVKEKLHIIIQMMEVLAKHAGRSEICLDDFKLYFRTASKEVYSKEQSFSKDGLSIHKLSKTVPSLKSHQRQSNVGKKGNQSSFLEFLFEKMTLAVQQNDVLNKPNENASKKNRQRVKHSTKQISKKVQHGDVLNQPNDDARGTKSKGDNRRDKHFTKQISEKTSQEENQRSLRSQKIQNKTCQEESLRSLRSHKIAYKTSQEENQGSLTSQKIENKRSKKVNYYEDDDDDFV